MARSWNVLFSGSRFIFWTLAPLLLLCPVSMTLLEDAWTFQNTATILAFDAIAVLLILALYNPKRFWWAAGGVTATVFVAYPAALVEEAFLGKEEFETGPLNAIYRVPSHRSSLPLFHASWVVRQPYRAQRARRFSAVLNTQKLRRYGELDT